MEEHCRAVLAGNKEVIKTSLLDETFLVVDTETTGVNPQTDKIVEIAAVLMRKGKVERTWESLVNPGMPIPAEASGIHHLTDDDVAGSPSLEEISEHLQDFASDASVIAAHNADFDRPFLPTVFTQPWLCTCRLSKHVWPSVPNFKNQTLRYWLNLKVDLNGKSPHRALPDALVTAGVLGAGIDTYLKNGGKDNVVDLMDYVNAPITIQKMTFGKYFGQLISEVATIDAEYLEWALSDGAYDSVKKKLMEDPDLKWSLERNLLSRK